MKELFSIDKEWIQSIPKDFNNAYNFLNSLNLDVFSKNSFALSIISSLSHHRAYYFNRKDNEWLKRFYSLCYNVFTNLDESIVDEEDYISALRDLCFIRSSFGQLYSSENIFILPRGTELLNKETPVVDPYFYSNSNKILNFFRNNLRIKEYGPRVEIEKLLNRYDSEYIASSFDLKYIQDMLSFAKYRKNHTDIDFTNKAIFMCQDSAGNYLLRCAYDLYLGKTYNNHQGEILASAYHNYCLWNGYRMHYKSDDMKLFLNFASVCGIKSELQIISCDVHRNPLFRDKLCFGNETKYATSSDYTIPDIEILLNHEHFSISKMIWVLLLQYSKRSKFISYQNEYVPDYSKATYSPNKQSIVKKCDSTLIYKLKQYAWIPNKQNKMFKPADILPNDLHDEFTFTSNDYLIFALQIGSSFEEQNQKRKRIEDELKKTNEHIISDEDWEFLQNAKRLRDRKTNSKSKSSQELFQDQNQISKANSNWDSISIQNLNSVQQATDGLEKTFNNADKMRPIERELFGRITESSKEERGLLQKWYHGQCQMCGTTIIGFNGSVHFYARNVINTQNLTANVRSTIKHGWNSLCLCPNCAMKYKVCSRDLNGFYNQILETETDDKSEIVLTIILNEHEQKIHYIPEHFSLLKKALELIDDSIEE